MKWLLLLLVSVNVILFAVQMKESGGGVAEEGFKLVVGAQKLNLLKDLGSEEGQRCVVVGEVPEGSALSAVTKILEEQGVGYEIIEKNVDLAPAYWVYITGDAGSDAILRLNEAGIDSYVISTGELKGKLSVGLFVNVDLARNRVKSLKEIGLSANYIEKKKVKSAQWVSFSLTRSELSVSVIKRLKEMPINIGEIKEFFCKSIASEK